MGKRACRRIVWQFERQTIFVHQQNKAIILSYCDRFNVTAYSVLQGCEACLYFLAILFVLRRGIGKRFRGAIRANYDRDILCHICKS